MLEQFPGSSGADLAQVEMRVFIRFLMKSTGCSSAMWEQCGIDCCKKVSMEFNCMDLKVQRFKYKKRFMEVKDKHHELRTTVDDCLEKYGR